MGGCGTAPFAWPRGRLIESPVVDTGVWLSLLVTPRGSAEPPALGAGGGIERGAATAESLPAGEGWQVRILGYCGCHLAKARRAAGDISQAQEELDRAIQRWKAGEGSEPGLLNAARILEIEASFANGAAPTPSSPRRSASAAIDKKAGDI